jgi:hypothetical protein
VFRVPDSGFYQLPFDKLRAGESPTFAETMADKRVTNHGSFPIGNRSISVYTSTVIRDNPVTTVKFLGVIE